MKYTGLAAMSSSSVGSPGRAGLAPGGCPFRGEAGRTAMPPEHVGPPEF